METAVKQARQGENHQAPVVGGRVMPTWTKRVHEEGFVVQGKVHVHRSRQKLESPLVGPQAQESELVQRTSD